MRSTTVFMGTIFLGAMAALLALGSPASAESVRCGSKLASEGDSLYRVRSVCGEPDAADRRIDVRTVRRKVRGPCFKRDGRLVCEHVEERSVEVVIDEWTYDFGSRRFVRLLTFEDGKLVSVRTDGYGTKE